MLNLGAHHIVHSKPASGSIDMFRAGSSGFVVTVLSLLVGVQVVQYFLISQKLSEDGVTAHRPYVNCDDRSGSATDNRQCVEMNMFKSWQHLAEPESADELLKPDDEHEPSKTTTRAETTKGTPETEATSSSETTTKMSEEEQERATEEIVKTLQHLVADLQLRIVKTGQEIEEQGYKLHSQDDDSSNQAVVLPAWPSLLEKMQQDADAEVAKRGNVTASPPGAERMADSDSVLELVWRKAAEWTEQVGEVAERRLRGTANASFESQIAMLSRATMQETAPNWIEGKPPKVACVTVIPQGRATVDWLKSFISNFRQQSYEGDRHLVLVYHREDRHTARLVREVATGSEDVKFGAAQGEKELPSATAFRFGAWLAPTGTQVIARWDFDAWHHPDRLAMQVRALALAGRPACMLARWTVVDEIEGHNVQTGGRWGATMVGDVEWMHWHWFPQLYGEELTDDLRRKHRLVEIDMPELVVYTELDTPGTSTTPTIALPQVVAEPSKQ